jgi:hypothetical protein
LQNAYYPDGIEPDRIKDRRTWLRLLWRSHTGKRLKEMLPDEIETFITEASPMIGTKPSDAFEADLGFMRSEIQEHSNAKIILACGKIAQAGLDKLGVTYISAPHPAWRLLSKRMTAEIKEKLLDVYQSDHPGRSA